MKFNPLFALISLPFVSSSNLRATPRSIPPSSSPNPPNHEKLAVAQHSSIGSSPASPTDIISVNLDGYASIARVAKEEGAQIIVFPEWGLFGANNPVRHRDTIKGYCEEINDSTLNDPTSVVGKLSLVARTNGVALTANVCESLPIPSVSFPGDDYVLYNTEVAFDTDGTMLAKYHKNHPWYTDTFDTPEKEVVKFKTSFGVTFGLIVCYDIVHDTPEMELLDMGVTQFPYSVAEPATLMGKEYFSHWTKKHKATLLASNLGNSGSGIFVEGKTIAMVDRGREKTFAIGEVVVDAFVDDE